MIKTSTKAKYSYLFYTLNQRGISYNSIECESKAEQGESK